MQYVEECGEIHPPTNYGVPSYLAVQETQFWILKQNDH
jgi:hypothetical protein